MAKRKQTRKPDPQPYLFPHDLFQASDEHAEPVFWSCLRSRPRWEKKLASWLKVYGYRHFLPTYRKTTISYRKRRVADMPLLPGYVFVQGNHNKEAFKEIQSVAYIIKPNGDQEIRELDQELNSLWKAVNSGEAIRLREQYHPGQKIVVSNGPLEGTIGTFLKEGKHGKLIIWMDVLGIGAEVELSQAYSIQVLDD
jgi:transcription antitermination factor NusG